MSCAVLFQLMRRTGYPIIPVFCKYVKQMSIKIKYFASLKESLGRAEDDIVFTEGLTVRKLWNSVHTGKPLPDNILVAINMEYAQFDSLVMDKDEVAFFPPVTGG